MFERFTDAARAAVVGAQTEARALGPRLDRHRAPAARRGAGPGPAGRPAAGRARADPRPVARRGRHDPGRARTTTARRCATSASTWTRSGPGSRSSSARARWTRSQHARRSRPRAACCGAAGGRPGRTAAGTSRSAAARRRRSSWPCASRWACGSREILVEHLVLGLMRADGPGHHRWSPGWASRRPTYAGRCWTGSAGRPDRPRTHRGQPTAAITSSVTSKLAQTFCTSSESSSASIRRKTFSAPSSSSGTLHRRQERRLGRVVVDAGVAAARSAPRPGRWPRRRPRTPRRGR